MLRWSGVSSELWKPPMLPYSTQTDWAQCPEAEGMARLEVVPRCGFHAYSSRVLGTKFGFIRNIWGLPTPHFHLLPPQPLGGRQYGQDSPGLGGSHSSSWPLHPSFPALNSHSLEELSKILLIYVLAFWALLFWGRYGHWVFK